MEQLYYGRYEIEHDPRYIPRSPESCRRMAKIFKEIEFGDGSRPTEVIDDEHY